jgi:hypothetical protein
MKSKTNQLTLIYIITALLGYRFSQTVPKVFSSYSGLPVLYFLKDLILSFLLVLL